MRKLHKLLYVLIRKKLRIVFFSPIMICSSRFVEWFGNRANVIDKYFKKGTVITLTGNMFSYKTKDGHKGWKIKVLDFDLPEFSEHDGNRNEHETSDQKDTFEDIDEDVPF